MGALKNGLPQGRTPLPLVQTSSQVPYTELLDSMASITSCDTSQKTQVTGMVNGQEVSFVVGTGASLSLLTLWHGPTFKINTPIMGVSGTPVHPLKIPPLFCIWIPLTIPLFHCHAKLPIPLLGRDLLHKLKAPISIPPLQSTSIFLVHSNLDLVPMLRKPPDHPLLARINSTGWDTSQPNIAKHQPPSKSN